MYLSIVSCNAKGGKSNFGRKSVYLSFVSVLKLFQCGASMGVSTADANASYRHRNWQHSKCNRHTNRSNLKQLS